MKTSTKLQNFKYAHLEFDLNKILFAPDDKGVIQYEQWKSIPDYEGSYEVSSFGRIKSFKKVNTIILKILTNKDGYTTAKLVKDKKKKTFRVHQLVVLAFFVEKPKGNKIVIDHKNGVRNQNYIWNLQVISQRLNSSKDQKGRASKYVGVGFYKRTGKWTSRIRLGKKELFLGYFDSELEASKRYQEALAEIKEKGSYEVDRKPPSSKYKGVHRSGNRFMAVLGETYLGTFETELEAYQYKLKQEERKKNGLEIETIKAVGGNYIKSRKNKFKGIYKRGKKWVLQINGKYIGTYETQKLALQKKNEILNN